MRGDFRNPSPKLVQAVREYYSVRDVKFTRYQGTAYPAEEGLERNRFRRSLL
jgi:hypothetical protein